MSNTSTKLSDVLKDDKTHMWSFSRIAGGVLLLWVFIVATCFVWFKGDITSNVVHVIEVFMTFAGGIYGANKGISHFSKLGSSIPLPTSNKEDEVEA